MAELASPWTGWQRPLIRALALFTGARTPSTDDQLARSIDRA
jgi:hypothetical protein